MVLPKPDLNELDRAIKSLSEAIILHDQAKVKSVEQKAFRDACIQRFEYTLELSWKISMKVLGSTIHAAKPAVRDMARNNLISDPSLWFSFIDARNNTSHSYDEEIAEKVFGSIKSFLPEVQALFLTLEKL